MAVFVELDKKNKVKALLVSSVKPPSGTFVEIPEYDDSLLSATYDSKTETFAKADPPPPPYDYSTDIKNVTDKENPNNKDVVALLKIILDKMG